MQAETIVLGAGIVGVSVAIHLVRRGRAVVLVDRRGAGEETSFGNAGLIQREGVQPHAFPQDLGQLLRYGLNTSIAMSYHPTALPGLAPFLFSYWRASWPHNYRRIVHAYEPLIRHSVSEHAALIAAADADALVVRNGWFELHRSAATRDAAFASAEWAKAEFGIHSELLDGAAMGAAEPALMETVAGAVHWTDPWTIRDPHALVIAYLGLFERLGGRFVTADATGLAQGAGGHGWRLPTPEGPLDAREAVVALGPWADSITVPLGYRLPLAVKRGYHMHYAPGDAGPAQSQWLLDADSGFLLAPMAAGIRLTTGAEFAPRDAPPTPVQLARAEPVARRLVPLGARLDSRPWMGARPATPDMMPIIGPAPRHAGLWFAFGHAHHGLTLGPATGRLIAEMMTGETPYVDPAPYDAARFRP